MIKSFYTASLLFDVLSVFGELSDENIQHRKYSRWKATYIHNCLKNGETPHAGPVGIEEGKAYDEEFGTEGGGCFQSFPNPVLPQPLFSGGSADQGLAVSSPNYSKIQFSPGSHINTPANFSHSTGEMVKPVPASQTMPSGDILPKNNNQDGDVHLTADDFTRAQKYCKYAGSALQYEDVATAIQNLQKALNLLTNGKE